MGICRRVFKGGQTIFWARQKAISTLFIPKFLFKLAILYLKFHNCQIPGPVKCLFLPIGADAHTCIWTLKHATYLITVFITQVTIYQLPIWTLAIKFCCIRKSHFCCWRTGCQWLHKHGRRIPWKHWFLDNCCLPNIPTQENVLFNRCPSFSLQQSYWWLHWSLRANIKTKDFVAPNWNN